MIHFLMEQHGGVFLQSSWAFCSLRHPWLRLLACASHLVASFFLSSSSPLLASTSRSSGLPIYGDWLATVCSGVSGPKILLHSLLSVAIITVLRLVAYRKTVQHAWNWRGSYRRATRTFSRLSGADERQVVLGADSEANRSGYARSMTLRVFTPRVTGRPTLTVDVANDPTQAQGSWTFVALCYPLTWWICVALMRLIVKAADGEGSGFHDLLQGEEDSTWLRELNVQRGLYVAVMTLSALRLVTTIDLVLQDRHYARALYSNWLVRVRKVYDSYKIVRIVCCWVAAAAIVIGGAVLGGFRSLQDSWIDVNLGDSGTALHSWFPNESWRSMLLAVIISLDVVWIVQAWTFPGFASVEGTRVFGWPNERLYLSFGIPKLEFLDVCFTSRWLSCFLVVAGLLPLEVCGLFQTLMYSPANYEQFESQDDFRVFPTNDTAYLSGEYDQVTQRMLEYGSISRYFLWSAWDRVPAAAVVVLAGAGLVWLCRHERFTMRYAAFLGMPAEQAKQRALAEVNAAIGSATKNALHTQLRLRDLYDQRAKSDGLCILLAAISVVAVLLQFRSIWLSPSQDQVSRPLQSPGEAYSVLLFFVTLVLIQQLCHRYALKMEIMTLKHAIPPEWNGALWKFPRRLLLPFVVEFVACALCLPPLLHGHVWMNEERFVVSTHSSLHEISCPRNLTLADGDSRACDLKYRYPLEIVNMVVLIRLYWFGRLVRNRLLKQIIAEPTLVAGGALQSLPVDSLVWSLRVSFALIPAELLATLFVLLWAGTAAALSVFERPFPSALDDEEYSLWLVIETMATVGYGDAFPVTGLGRAAVFLGAIVGGTVFISLLLSVLLDSMKGSKHDHKVVASIERVQWERSLRNLASRVIARAWQLHQTTETSASKTTPQLAERRLLRAAYRFKLWRKDKPRETYESLKRLEMRTISLWRQHEATEVMEQHRQDTQDALAALEAHIDRIEESLRALTN